MKETEITVTGKGQCNLSKVRTQQHSFYLAHEEADGTIILVPASLVPARLASAIQGGGVLEKSEPLPWEIPGETR